MIPLGWRRKERVIERKTERERINRLRDSPRQRTRVEKDTYRQESTSWLFDIPADFSSLAAQQSMTSPGIILKRQFLRRLSREKLLKNKSRRYSCDTQLGSDESTVNCLRLLEPVNDHRIDRYISGGALISKAYALDTSFVRTSWEKFIIHPVEKNFSRSWSGIVVNERKLFLKKFDEGFLNENK